MIYTLLLIPRVLLGILGGGVVPGSPNPDLIADQKIVIFHTRFQTRSLKSIPIFGPGTSPFRSIRFGDVSEANGRETASHFRMDHVT